jgi:hypothetical protein
MIYILLFHAPRFYDTLVLGSILQCSGSVNITFGSEGPINYRSGRVGILPRHFFGHYKKKIFILD